MLVPEDGEGVQAGRQRPGLPGAHLGVAPTPYAAGLVASFRVLVVRRAVLRACSLPKGERLRNRIYVCHSPHRQPRRIINRLAAATLQGVEEGSDLRLVNHGFLERFFASNMA